MSKLLQKILSAALFPAALVIVSKIAGMLLVNEIFNLNWGIQTSSGGLFTVQILYEDPAKALLCNSYSSLFVLIVLAIGVGILLFQGAFLHTTHQNPRVLVKLINFNFLLWLTESDIIFPRLAVWLMFLWIISILNITQALQGDIYPFVAVVGFVLSIISTALAFRDFERDLQTMMPEHGTLNT